MSRRPAYDPAVLAGKPVTSGTDSGDRTIGWMFANRPSHRYSGEEAYCRICGQPGDGTGRHDAGADPGTGLGAETDSPPILMTPRLRAIILAALTGQLARHSQVGPYSRADFEWAETVIAGDQP